MNRVSRAKHLKKELERRHGTSDLAELERQGIVTAEDKARAGEEALRDIAKEQGLSKKEEDALVKQSAGTQGLSTAGQKEEPYRVPVTN
jgi:hypothetical protein